MKHIQENKTFSPGGVICSVDGYTTDENLNKTLDRIINNLDRINPAPEITNKEK